MKQGGRGLIIGLAIAVLFAVLPIAGSAPAAAQTSGEDEQSDGRLSDGPSWPDMNDRVPPAPGLGEVEQAQQHIINGTPIGITERPWHVLMSDESLSGSWCGGSILAANLILTAAHCVDNGNLEASTLLVVAGSDQWRDVENGQWRYARNVTIHPSYNPNFGFDGSQGLDLALIELARPLTFNASVQPIELADAAEAAAALGGAADLVGWGVNTLPADDGDTVATLLNGSGEIVSDTFCGALIGRPVNAANEMCLDTIETSQAGCFGDSGGGTTMEIGGVRKLLGVASFTVSDCGFDLLVLAEITPALAWIEANTPPIAASAGFVYGRVWNDADFDSTEDPQEAGVAGVEVTLEITPPAGAASSPISLTAFTDTDGRYSFVAPFGGWYDILVTLDPLVVLSPPSATASEATNTDILGRSRDPLVVEPTIGYTNRFLVTPGYSETDIDIGASPGALVSGVIFDDLNRNGGRDAAEPLTSGLDAYIDVYRTNPFGELETAIDYRYLGDTDSFRFAVPPGTAYLEFYDGFTSRRVTVPNRGDDDGNSFSPFTNQTERFGVAQGQTYTFDLGLTPSGSGDAFADVANTDCDGEVSIIDALVIAQYTAGVRSDAASCPLADPATQIVVANADINLDGVTDIIDALVVAQCEAGLATPFCTALD